MFPYLQLCRLPTVFTAFGDVVAGAALARGDLRDQPLPLAALLVSSGCLYLAGMVLNDLFDREIDRVERPGRPIPSGRVPVAHARLFGTGLCVAGVAASSFAGLHSLCVAVALLVAVIAYDAVLKHTVVGPASMGVCRGLNVMLGATFADLGYVWPLQLGNVWGMPAIGAAGALTVYISGVTLFAKTEAAVSRRGMLALGATVVNAGLLGLAALVWNTPDGFGTRINSLLVLGVAMFVINRRLFAAISDPIPAHVQGAVKSCLLSLILLQAMLVLFAQPDRWIALVVAALMVPCLVLARRFAVT
jgi:4-hydroxybenzoate polyprenyltransferase